MPDIDQRPIARLRRISVALHANAPPDPDDAAWMISAVQRYEGARRAGLSLDLDLAFGMGQPGRHGWWTQEAIEERDSLLRELRSRYFAEMADGDAAREIKQTIMGMGSHQARQDPALTALVAIVQRTGQAIPGHKQLKRILSAGHMLP